MNYKIVWEIELDADNPLDAAEEAMNCITNGTAKVFTVQDNDDKLFEIDLCDNTQKGIIHYTPLIKGK